MHKNQDLYHFFKEHSLQLTEDWYNQLDDENEFSVYSSENPAIVKELKQQNQDYFQHLFDVFIKDEEYFFSDFQQWSIELARDP
ncbi:RsbT co-antagonist protein RsbRB, partial [Priestia megaterium]